jgi:histidinol-phosphatase
MADRPNPETLRDLAVAGARAGGAAALVHFRSPDLAVETKLDESPVTRADREAEAAVRAVILGARPQDGWLGEETGSAEGQSGLLWIVDPVDGTKNFVRGKTGWTTLVACEDQATGEVVASAVFQPAVGRMAEAAKGFGARLDGVRLQVSDRRELATSRWVFYSDEWFHRHGLGALHTHLAAAKLLDSEGCDADGHVRIAEGLCDAVVEPRVAVWDVAATSLLVAEAGGRLTDMQGNATLRAGNAVISNGWVHDQVLELVARLTAPRA